MTARTTSPSSSELMYGRDPAVLSDWLVWSYLQSTIQRRGVSSAVTTETGCTSFAELAARANALAHGLQQLGVGAGDVVSYQLPNWIETLTVLLAALRLGAIANPIVPIYRHRELGFIMAQARSKVIFVPGIYRGFDYGAMAINLAVGTGTRVISCRDPDGELRFEDVARATEVPLKVAGDPDADAFLLYTSGTEGEPKGVRHSQRTLIADAHAIIASTDIGPEDNFYLATPLTHVTGLLYGQLVPMVAGIRVCLADRWDPHDAAATIARNGCTLMCGATPFLQGLVDDPSISPRQLKSLRAFRCGGADVPPDLIRRAHARGIYALRTYGCTEHPTLTGTVHDGPISAAETDGRVHAYNRVRIVPDASLADGIGEIQTRGPELFLGYRDPALDHAAFTTDGWYRTGDLGRISQDGFITVAGRRKDVIIRKGENISAKEIEDILLTHDSIQSAAVIGLPDPTRGEMVTAVCVLVPGATWSLQAMAAHVATAGLARQKIPERLEIIDAMPVTAAGKIRKAELRARFGKPNL